MPIAAPGSVRQNRGESITCPDRSSPPEKSRRTAPDRCSRHWRHRYPHCLTACNAVGGALPEVVDGPVKERPGLLLSAAIPQGGDHQEHDVVPELRIALKEGRDPDALRLKQIDLGFQKAGAANQKLFDLGMNYKADEALPSTSSACLPTSLTRAWHPAATASPRNDSTHRLGHKIRALRIATGATGGELAIRPGMSQSMLSRIERGLAHSVAGSRRGAGATLQRPQVWRAAAAMKS